MVRKSFKSLSQKVFFISILVSIFFAAGCNNGSAPAEDPKPISGKAASEGNVITVQVPENVAIVEIVVIVPPRSATLVAPVNIPPKALKMTPHT